MKKKLKRPRCPVCRDRMVRIHIENHDRSGWFHGWTCTCDNGYGFKPHKLKA